MKVYVASPYFSVAAARPVARHIESAGYSITARWLFEKEEPGDKTAYCKRDLDDIRQSDALLILTDEHPFNGRHVEAGYALGLGIPVVVLGPATNIFYRHLCRVVDTLAEAVYALDDIGEGK